MSNSITHYLHYKNIPDVRDFISEIRAAISKDNPIVKNQMSLYHFPPKIDLNFNDSNLQVIYSKGTLTSENEPCKDFSFLFDYEDFKDSEMLGRTIKQVLRSGILGINFPNIPTLELDFKYEFGADNMKVSVCHNLPF
jgi:hypothetical protein